MASVLDDEPTESDRLIGKRSFWQFSSDEHFPEDSSLNGPQSGRLKASHTKQSKLSQFNPAHIDLIQTSAAFTGSAPEPSNQDDIQMEVEEEYSVADELCFGALPHCRISSPNGFGLDRNVFLSIWKEKNPRARYDISPVQMYFVVKSTEGEDFAVLDSHTTRILQKLLHIGPLRFQLSLMDERYEGPSKRSSIKALQNRLIEVSINAYGAENLSKGVGEALSKEQIFLQHPDSIDPGIRYINPQYFYQPGELDVLDHKVGLGDHKFTSVQSISSEVDGILESLDEVKEGPYIPDHGLVMTPLLNHQRAALGFIQQRESLPSHSCMLRRTTREDTDFATTIVSQPIASGILADAVGLGKTLTMLSAVFYSLDAALRFSLEKNPGLAHENGRTPTRATLIVVPSAQIIEVWKAQIACHLDSDGLNVATFLGQDRPREVGTFENLDLVLTTYSTLTRDSQTQRSLQQMHWFRIILDEAHWIRNQETKQFQAVDTLYAERRWCLTATPIHNKLEDLGALVRFLKISHFCGTSPRIAFWRYIIQPLSAGGEDPCYNLRILLQATCLRRTNVGQVTLDTIFETKNLEMSSEERELYETILALTKDDIDQRVSTLSSMQTYAKIFTALSKLRRLCSFGTLDQPRNDESQKGRFTDATRDVDRSCELCQKEECHPASTESPVCPNCLRPLVGVYDGGLGQSVVGNEYSPSFSAGEHDLHSNGIDMELLDAHATSSSGTEGLCSTKLHAVAEELIKDMASCKSIAFSCWTGTLNILSELLEQRHVPHTRIDGDVSYTERSRRLQSFSNDPELSVLLMTLGTGSVGLNLAVANRIHIIEPQWNPMTEEQAIGRALRLGQTRQVTVTRYVMQDSIEQTIVQMQNKKRGLANLVLSSVTKESATKE